MDAHYEHPRLVSVYDALEADRPDLDAYVAIAHELRATDVADIGCGTGVFALMLADRGVRVMGVDPAAGSLRFARSKPGAARVTWIEGDARALPPGRADLATMTGNVAQAIVTPEHWKDALGGAFAALRPGGRLVFETRDRAKRAWLEWNRADSHGITEVPGLGAVEHYVELTSVEGPLVAFRQTYRFPDDEELISDSTLRFRGADEVRADLAASGFELLEIRDAPDRPGRELVFFARRP